MREASRPRFGLIQTLAAVMMVFGVGCALGPMLTEGVVETPEAVVESARVVDQTDAGFRAEIVVRLINPNDVALRVERASVAFRLDGLKPYEARMEPTVALPPSGEQLWTVPVALAKPTPGWAPAGRRYRFDAELRFVPPGELREILTDSGVPLPWVEVSGAGEFGAGVDAADATAG